MRIIPESVSLSELQIDLASSIALLQNLVFSGLGIASSFNFSDSFVFFSGACLVTSLSFLCSIALCLCIFFFLSSSELLGKFLMLHHMPCFSK